LVDFLNAPVLFIADAHRGAHALLHSHCDRAD
jgi:hypothetical protein